MPLPILDTMGLLGTATDADAPPFNAVTTDVATSKALNAQPPELAA